MRPVSAPGWSVNHRVSGVATAAACRVAPSSRPPVVEAGDEHEGHDNRPRPLGDCRHGE